MSSEECNQFIDQINRKTNVDDNERCYIDYAEECYAADEPALSYIEFLEKEGLLEKYLHSLRGEKMSSKVGII
jgi:hypothetical protein